MSGASAVRYLLANAAAVIAQVPAARIVVTPQLGTGVTLPAINVMRISDVTRLTASMGETRRMHTERVQVMVHAATVPSLRAIVLLVRAALPLSRGTVNSVKVDSILPDLEGPDLSDAEASIFRQPLDFIVKWSSS